ncbi:hypothetical protein A2707_06125 [Candidatus Saccharibacteria bacterium RIFCSPHIGHO2_01_FULL_45_15]|nr:MAG: hypothetical protein A2707_06125 [Candidatus Saccharibacteria bacterium RIFCSPHIGHO2_01_FULL_45_15]OGL26814.1 MAG: hypothetical protein A3C39_04070 [Candidatus Saccharibacteria bacterium RIFCSPHIGHO2_02_FULL_46_12]OGL32036.1 MAG: hypothetical protein A3E76_02065 [Candidatus Saccharibacteria bacterium RIFCSPHIGHO2_12_FULL_44_22]
MANFNSAPSRTALYDQAPIADPFAQEEFSNQTQQSPGVYYPEPIPNYYNSQPMNSDPFGYPVPATESLPQIYNSRGNLPSSREKGEGLRAVLNLGSKALDVAMKIKNVIGNQSSRMNSIPTIPQGFSFENTVNTLSQQAPLLVENRNQYVAQAANYVSGATVESTMNVAADVGQFAMDRYGLQRDREARFGITVANKRRFAKGIIRAGLNPSGEALALGRGAANVGRKSAFREGRRQVAAARSNARGMARAYARSSIS